MKKKALSILCCLILIASCMCCKIFLTKSEINNNIAASVPNTDKNQIKLLTEKYRDKVPHQWGEKVSGVKTRLNTRDRVVALTFDACGGKHGSGYDKELIDYLVSEKVPATLFINYRWIDANFNTFISLSKNPLFEIENHGYAHKPLSVNGKSAYGIVGTKNVFEVILEVLPNEHRIQKLTGRKPKYFRPGTAYSDEVAASIVKDLGEEEISFSILGDAGATFNKEQILSSCLKSTPGSIIICHMNHPEKETAEGMKLVVPELRRRGFRFVKLSNYPLQ